MEPTNNVYTSRNPITERSGMLTSGRGNQVFTTREFENYLDNKRGSSPRKATTSRPRKKKRKKK
jgi:hypothetical protein